MPVSTSSDVVNTFVFAAMSTITDNLAIPTEYKCSEKVTVIWNGKGYNNGLNQFWFWLTSGIVVCNVFTPTRNALDVSMHRSQGRCEELRGPIRKLLAGPSLKVHIWFMILFCVVCPSLTKKINAWYTQILKDHDSFIYFFNTKYNNSKHNVYSQVFNELCTLWFYHPKLNLLSHMTTFSFSRCSSQFFSWKCLNYNGDLTASANSLAPILKHHLNLDNFFMFFVNCLSTTKSLVTHRGSM